MAVLTVRDKNQVTVPRRLLDEAGLKPGDPIEFASLPGGGIGIYPFGWQEQRESVWDIAVAVARAVPGIEDVDIELPSRDCDARDVVW